MSPERRRERLGVGHRLAVDPQSLIVGAQVDPALAETGDERIGGGRMLVPRRRAIPEEKEHGREIVGDLRRNGH